MLPEDYVGELELFLRANPSAAQAWIADSCRRLGWRADPWDLRRDPTRVVWRSGGLVCLTLEGHYTEVGLTTRVFATRCDRSVHALLVQLVTADAKLCPRLDRPEQVPLVLWEILRGRAWHATSASGFHGIRSTGVVRPSSGFHYHGLSQYAGAVSCFDFTDASWQQDQPNAASSWTEWAGHQQRHQAGAEPPVGYWIDVSRFVDSREWRSPAAVDVLWRFALAQRRSLEDMRRDGGTNFLPGIEAFHVGAIELDGSESVLQLSDGARVWKEVGSVF